MKGFSQVSYQRSRGLILVQGKMDLGNPSISISSLVLFLTLWCYGFEIMYRYMVLLTAIAGLKWP